MKIGVLNRHQEIRTLWFKIGVIYVNACTLWFSRICSKIYPKFLPKFLLKFLQKDYLGFLLESITEFLLEKHSGFLNIYPLLQISSWDSFQNWFRDSSRNLFLDSLRNSFLDFSCTSPVFLEFLFTICRGFPSKFFFPWFVLKFIPRLYRKSCVSFNIPIRISSTYGIIPTGIPLENPHKIILSITTENRLSSLPSSLCKTW